MKLRLNVTSDPNRPSDPALWAEFTERGGTIGRNERNHLALPDPDRFISSEHAAIHFLDGSFQIEDRSTNGVFINQSESPIGRGNLTPLNQGDQISIGDYEIAVDIVDGENLFASAPLSDADRIEINDDIMGAPVSGWSQAPYSDQDIQSTGPSTFGPEPASDDGLGIIPNLPGEDVLAADDGVVLADGLGIIPHLPGEDDQPIVNIRSEPNHVAGHASHMQDPQAVREQMPQQIPVDFWADPAPGPQLDDLPGVGPSEPPMSQPDQADATPEPLAPRLRSPVSQTPSLKSAPVTSGPEATPSSRADGRQPPEAGAVGGHEAAVAQILAGAGVSSIKIPPELQEEFFHDIGALVREAVAGLVEILRARAEIKSQFRIQATTIRPRENNPLKLAVSADEALGHLLASRNDGYLAPVAAVEEALRDLKAHQLAVMAGMQVALKSLLKQFEPHSLERYFQAQGGKGVLESKNAWYWEQYQKVYATIIANAEDNFQELFGDEFAKAYQSQIAKLHLLDDEKNKRY